MPLSRPISQFVMLCLEGRRIRLLPYVWVWEISNLSPVTGRWGERTGDVEALFVPRYTISSSNISETSNSNGEYIWADRKWKERRSVTCCPSAPFYLAGFPAPFRQNQIFVTLYYVWLRHYHLLGLVQWYSALYTREALRGFSFLLVKSYCCSQAVQILKLEWWYTDFPQNVLVRRLEGGRPVCLTVMSDAVRRTWTLQTLHRLWALLDSMDTSWESNNVHGVLTS